MAEGFLFKVRSYSPLHAGIGQSIGKVDLPIEREKHTEYPCVYATGLKGSLRSYCKHHPSTEMNNTVISKIFGSEDGDSGAGGVVFTDLKILLFPVRSSEGSFKWVTCEDVIKRFKRDYKIVNNADCPLSFGSKVDHVGTVARIDPQQHIILEDFVFNKKTSGTSAVLGMSLNDIYVVDDNIFKYFVTNATQIIARNKLDDIKKTSENLWYEEALPAETVMYSFVVPSITGNSEITTLKNHLNNKVIQIGGNETVGYGITELTAIERS